MSQEIKNELINDLVSVTTILEEIWKYHPDNPDQEDIVAEYNQLLKIQGDIENELEALD
jgi:hypothetical protein